MSLPRFTYNLLFHLRDGEQELFEHVTLEDARQHFTFSEKRTPTFTRASPFTKPTGSKRGIGFWTRRTSPPEEGWVAPSRNAQGVAESRNLTKEV